MLDLLAHRGSRRLGYGFVAGESCPALKGEGPLVEGASGQRALNQLCEPREYGVHVGVLVAAQQVEKCFGQLPADPVLRQRVNALSERLERAELDGGPRRPREHRPREKGQVVLRVVAVDVLLTEERQELPAQRLEVPARRR